jgi:hypothetical protein
MSDKKELTVVTLQTELPTEFVGQLPDIFWTRLEMLIKDMLRLNQPKGSDLFPSVWKVSPPSDIDAADFGQPGEKLVVHRAAPSPDPPPGPSVNSEDGEEIVRAQHSYTGPPLYSGIAVDPFVRSTPAPTIKKDLTVGPSVEEAMGRISLWYRRYMEALKELGGAPLAEDEAALAVIKAALKLKELV